MSLKSASTDSLMQLADLIGQLSDADYARPLPVLSGNTIGKHIRHIVEFYELLIRSVATAQREARSGMPDHGVPAPLNYDRRQRDLQLETDTDETLRRISRIDRAISRIDLNQPLCLEADLSVAGSEPVQIPSTVARELLYNVEHAVHHMALIQVAVRHEFPAVELPDHFGVAYSTVQHQAVSH
ncbi:DinB family protein [Fibrella arboris]|uniref:DinB family protein n=1 Tax=Fibrella arboris TaxID=3242486 RepID=UPI003522AA24